MTSISGLYCDIDGDDGHDVHGCTDPGGLRTSWVAPAITNHAREAQLFAGYLTGVAYDVVRQLDHVTSLIEQAELHRAVLVDQARRAGVSWTVIGQQTGVSKQAAAQRYGERKAAAPDRRQPSLTDLLDNAS